MSKVRRDRHDKVTQRVIWHNIPRLVAHLCISQRQRMEITRPIALVSAVEQEKVPSQKGPLCQALEPGIFRVRGAFLVEEGLTVWSFCGLDLARAYFTALSLFCCNLKAAE